MLKQNNNMENYKYIIKETCAKHISESISELKTLRSHISSLECENSWYLLMEHHESECYLIKQNQENDRSRLIKAFDLKSLFECSKIDYVINLINIFQVMRVVNYDDEISKCINSLCIADTYRAVLEIEVD